MYSGGVLGSVQGHLPPTESVDVQHSFVVAHIHPMPKTGFVTSFAVSHLSHFWQAALCIIQ